MIFEDCVLYAGQRSLDGLNLLQDVDAVSIFLDHSTDSPNLSLNAIEALLQSFFINNHVYLLTYTP